jgi:hypothetical protein
MPETAPTRRYRPLPIIDEVVAERDALKAAIQRLAAEAHRRKWAHEHSSPAAFDVLHRIGNELLATLNPKEILSGSDVTETPGDAEEDDRWRRDEREIDGGFSGNEFPRLWPPRTTPETTPDAPTEETDG